MVRQWNGAVFLSIFMYEKYLYFLCINVNNTFITAAKAAKYCSFPLKIGVFSKSRGKVLGACSSWMTLSNSSLAGQEAERGEIGKGGEGKIFFFP